MSLAGAALSPEDVRPESGSTSADRCGTPRRCTGKLVAGVTDLLYTEVSRLIPDSKRIVLDLAELTYMDPDMGLGTIIRLYVSATVTGCELELTNIGQRIQQLLGINGQRFPCSQREGEHHVRRSDGDQICGRGNVSRGTMKIPTVRAGSSVGRASHF